MEEAGAQRLHAADRGTPPLPRPRAQPARGHAGADDAVCSARSSAVAKAQDIALDEDERWEAITGLLERAVGAKASMLQDVEAGRQTEIDVINGAIVERRQQHAGSQRR